MHIVKFSTSSWWGPYLSYILILSVNILFVVSLGAEAEKKSNESIIFKTY